MEGRRRGLGMCRRTRIHRVLVCPCACAGKLPHSAENQGGKGDDRSTISRGQQECPDPDGQGTFHLPGLRSSRQDLQPAAECGANPSAEHLQDQDW